MKQKKLTKTQKRKRQQFLNESCNVLMPSSSSEYDSESYDDETSDLDQLSRKIFGNGGNIGDNSNQKYDRTKVHYCAYCAGRHFEEECKNR